MKKRELINMGIPAGEPVKAGIQAAIKLSRAGANKVSIRTIIAKAVAAPDDYVDDPACGALAKLLLLPDYQVQLFTPREEPAQYRQWGRNLDRKSIEQMERACKLPVSVAGALMPDAHVGYGLPIGGVLAVENAVIPYAVGVDIACRMKLTVLDMPAHALKGQSERLTNAIAEETRFGIGCKFRQPRDHEVMDEDWCISPVTRQHKDKARSQLGTSGSGNHFVEFGILTLDEADLGLQPGEYLALLSHSGSRGIGSLVANYYSKLAQEKHRELPKELVHLAWLGLDTSVGQEYWATMNLMGRYAAANHALIHRYIARNLGAKVLADVENHHNFAWKEEHFGKQVIVHRKGATPADKGTLGIIPGSMATPGFVVRGKGQPDSMRSASHGAGRVMSRKKAKQSLTWHEAKKIFHEQGVQVISAGLDEVPMVYKDIHEVMDAQKDLVDTVARFDPKLVKMAPSGERPGD